MPRGNPAAPHAVACCPDHALVALSPDHLAALDAWCARALDDPDAEPQPGDEAAAVAWTSQSGCSGGYGRR